MGCASGKSVTVTATENGYTPSTLEHPTITISSPQPPSDSLKPPEVIIEGERPPSSTRDPGDEDGDPMNPFDDGNGDSLDNTIREIQLTVPDTNPEANADSGEGDEVVAEDEGNDETPADDQDLAAEENILADAEENLVEDGDELVITEEDGQPNTPEDEEEIPPEPEEPEPNQEEEEGEGEGDKEENELDSKMDQDNPPDPLVITAVSEE